MPNKTSRDVFNNPKMPIILLLVSGCIILLGAMFMWRSFVHTSPERTFWGMVENNLQTNGVTRHITQENEAGSLSQYSQIEFGAAQIARGRTNISQQDASGETTNVTSEAISTPRKSFVRYVDIETTAGKNEAPNFNEVIGVWGEEAPLVQSQNAFTEVVFGIIPVADLTSAQRTELMRFIADNNVYDVSFDDIKRTDSDDSTVYEYPVQVNMGGYVGMLIELDRMLGLGQLEGLDASQYTDTPPTQITVAVDIRSRQARSITFAQSGHTERFEAYGARLGIETPTDTIPRPELEENLQNILQ